MRIGKTSIVQLKSGGPPMMVVGIVGDQKNNEMAESSYKKRGFKAGDLICQWFDASNVLQYNVFPAETVEEPGLVQGD